MNEVLCLSECGNDRTVERLSPPLKVATQNVVSYVIGAYTSEGFCSHNPAAGIKRADVSPTIDATVPTPAKWQGGLATVQASRVRRLTPVECERLQGMPDNYTRIPYRGKPADECPDSPRYRAIGNSWAVPVVRWIGKRIDDALKEQKQ